MSDFIPLSVLSKIEKVNFYGKISKDYINMEGIFSDETENFISPIEPSSTEEVTIKIRTFKSNIDCVYISFEEKEKKMYLLKSDDLFDYYSITLEPIKSTIKYFFSIIKNDEKYFYNKRGLYKEIDHVYDFTLIPDFKTPQWSKGSVMYQIYVDRFFNGDTTNDVLSREYLYLGKTSEKIDNWDQDVATDDVCNFYGGDLQGVIQKMSYLKDLGIEAIYFNPIFVSPSNHKYDIQDYDYIDPHYGVIIEDSGELLKFEKFKNKYASMYIQRTTNKANLEASNKLMIELIKISHANGIKVILDGVFNHCGAFNKWLDREGFYKGDEYPVGAYREKNSKYHDYFKWYDSNWPNNDCYEGWWGHDNHPKLNFEASKELCDYILSVGAKWVSPPFNADGWRLDVAADLGSTKEFNHKFWKEFRNVVKSANKDAIILAEHYGDPGDWLKGDQWDTVMNYDAFMDPITWFLTGMEKHSEEYKPEMLNNAMVFEESMRYFMSRFSYQSLFCSMNELSNHDHSRFLTRTNMTTGRLHTKGKRAADINVNLGVMMEAVTFQMTWQGAPTVYYGDEAGVTGWTDPDNRRTYPWGMENLTLLDFHKKIIEIHKNSKALRIGSLEYLYTNYGILSFGRWYDDEKIVVILNNNSVEQVLTIPVWKINIPLNGYLRQLIGTDVNNYYSQSDEFNVKDGQLIIKVPAYSSIILESIRTSLLD